MTEIVNQYPKDNLILSYYDFLKLRNYIGYYKFNTVVFDNLLTLVNNEWENI